MTDSAYAARLARTYCHTLSAFRPLPDGGEEMVCHGQRCALSRAAQVASPSPPDGAGPLPEAEYRLSLFTGPEVLFRLGDRLEIADGQRLFLGTASDSFRYPSHTVTVVQVREVGQVSHETDGGE